MALTKQEKYELYHDIKNDIKSGVSRADTINRQIRYGYKPSTVKKYYRDISESMKESF
jgi:hypothetical protein